MKYLLKYFSSNAITEATRQYKRDWRKRNKERISQYNRDWSKRNRDKINRYKRAWSRKNIEKIRQYRQRRRLLCQLKRA